MYVEIFAMVIALIFGMPWLVLLATLVIRRMYRS